MLFSNKELDAIPKALGKKREFQIVMLASYQNLTTHRKEPVTNQHHQLLVEA